DVCSSDLAARRAPSRTAGRPVRPRRSVPVPAWPASPAEAPRGWACRRRARPLRVGWLPRTTLESPRRSCLRCARRTASGAGRGCGGLDRRPRAGAVPWSVECKRRLRRAMTVTSHVTSRCAGYPGVVRLLVVRLSSMSLGHSSDLPRVGPFFAWGSHTVLGGHVSRQVVGVTLDNLEDLPRHCRKCVYWEVAPHLRGQVEEFGETELEKEAWVSSVLLEWGSCGRLLYSNKLPVGFVLYAPPTVVPRAGAFPTSPASPDAVLLTAFHVQPEFRGGGIGRALVQEVAKDLTRRGVRAIEAFGDAQPE